MKSVKEIKEDLFERVTKYHAFKDTLTGSYPKNEVQLSSIFGLLLQQNKINLSKITLYKSYADCTLYPTKTLANILKDKFTVIEEFPLFANNEKEIRSWGAMTIDISVFNDNFVVFIENKIGSSFTSGGQQLIKQVEFLKKAQVDKKILVVLSSKQLFEKKWYIKELNDALSTKDDKNNIEGYFICWEEVFLSSIE